MTTFETVLLGITSSLIATFIFLYLSWITKTVILPWYEDKIYRGVRIDGHWIAEKWDGTDIDEIAAISEATIEIKQKADHISGIYSHVDRDDGDTTSYVFKGEIRNSYVTASSWPIARDHIDAGAFVLNVYSDNGLKMKGMISYIGDSGNVGSCSVEFKKKDS